MSVRKCSEVVLGLFPEAGSQRGESVRCGEQCVCSAHCAAKEEKMHQKLQALQGELGGVALTEKEKCCEGRYGVRGEIKCGYGIERGAT